MVNDHCEFSEVIDASPRYGDDSRSIIGIKIFHVNYHRSRLESIHCAKWIGSGRSLIQLDKGYWIFRVHKILNVSTKLA